MFETGIDEGALKELYEVFLEEILREKDRLETSLVQEDHAGLWKTVHTIKGISGSYKANVVYKQARRLDLDIKERRFETIKTRLETLTAEIENAATDIKRRFGI